MPLSDTTKSSSCDPSVLPPSLDRQFLLQSTTSSRCKTLPLVCSSSHGAVTTSLQRCVNFIVCQSRDEWNLRLRVSYTNRSRQLRQRTCLPTFDSSPSIVVLISVHPLTEHWLFHGRAPASGTEVSLLRDRASAVKHFAVYVTTDDQLRTVSRHLKAHTFRAYESRRTATYDFFAPYKYPYALTYSNVQKNLIKYTSQLSRRNALRPVMLHKTAYRQAYSGVDVLKDELLATT